MKVFLGSGRHIYEVESGSWWSDVAAGGLADVLIIAEPGHPPPTPPSPRKDARVL